MFIYIIFSYGLKKVGKNIKLIKKASFTLTMWVFRANLENSIGWLKNNDKSIICDKSRLPKDKISLEGISFKHNSCQTARFNN